MCKEISLFMKSEALMGLMRLSADEKEDTDMEILDKASEMLKRTAEYNNLVKSLAPLIEAIRNSDTAKDFLKSADVDIFQNRFEKSGRRMKKFKEDSKTSGTDETTILRKAFLYLALFETSTTNLIDLVLMIFIANGHDFYVYRSRKYAKKLDDLDDCFISEKLDFLNHHGLVIFSEHINKKLRNKIAHLDFDVEADGKILIGQQKYDLQDELVHLEAILLAIANALKECKLPELLRELS